MIREGRHRDGTPLRLGLIIEQDIDHTLLVEELPDRPGQFYVVARGHKHHLQYIKRRLEALAALEDA